MKKRNEPPVEFTTGSGRRFVLIFECPEYRAYEIVGNRKVPMWLGSAVPEPLVKFIKERW